MRVNSCSFHCPSYCFSKTPPQPLPSPPPPPPPQCQAYALHAEDSHHTSCSPCSGSLVEDKLCDEKLDIGENGVDGGKKAFLLKSSLKKRSPDCKEIAKDCVKWTDDLGKELTEIREFESTAPGEQDDEMSDYPACHCVII